MRPDGSSGPVCVELIGKAVGGGMFTDRHQVGQDVLSREQIIEQLAEGDPERRKLAEQLLNAPRNFEEGANEQTRKLANDEGVSLWSNLKTWPPHTSE